MSRAEARRGIFEGCECELDKGEEFWSVNIVVLIFPISSYLREISAISMRLSGGELRGRHMLAEVINAKWLQILIALTVIAPLVVLASTHFLLRLRLLVHGILAFN